MLQFPADLTHTYSARLDTAFEKTPRFVVSNSALLCTLFELSGSDAGIRPQQVCQLFGYRVAGCATWLGGHPLEVSKFAANHLAVVVVVHKILVQSISGLMHSKR